MVIFIECIILCLVFTLMVNIMAKDPIKTLYNYPPKIQERVKSLEEYKGSIPTNKNMIVAKVSVSIFIILVITFIMKYINGVTSFKDAFLESFFIWTVVNIYDALIIDILWFCQRPRFVFKGTEDMRDEYRNYWFHIKESLKGEIIALVVCSIVGLLIQFVL